MRQGLLLQIRYHDGRRRLLQWRLSIDYHFVIQGNPTVLTVESPFDGTEFPVLLAGKPSGETMAITRVDQHHTSTILKMNGQLFGTSKATLSENGKTLTVTNEFSTSAGG